MKNKLFNFKEHLGLNIILILALAATAFYIFTEHLSHVIAYSGVIAFLVMILMHLFMHGGHGGQGGHGKH